MFHEQCLPDPRTSARRVSALAPPSPPPHPAWRGPTGSEIAYRQEADDRRSGEESERAHRGDGGDPGARVRVRLPPSRAEHQRHPVRQARDRSRTGPRVRMAGLPRSSTAASAPSHPPAHPRPPPPPPPPPSAAPPASVTSSMQGRAHNGAARSRLSATRLDPRASQHPPPPPAGARSSTPPAAEPRAPDRTAAPERGSPSRLAPRSGRARPTTAGVPAPGRYRPRRSQP